MKKVILVLGIVISLTSCYRDVEKIKKDAPMFLEKNGYQIITYDGDRSQIISGGYVDYKVMDSSNYVYSIAIQEWRGIYVISDKTCLNCHWFNK